MYQHILQDSPAPLTPGKVVCVGRNYAAHARELNNPVPAEPLLFLKPSTSLVPFGPAIVIPVDHGSVHHELEIALLIGQPLRLATEAECTAAIAGVGLALDLTLREVQDRLKTASHPWEIAKAFDGSCPVSPFLPPDALPGLTALHFALHRNGQPAQQGDTADMLTPIPALLAFMSRHFTLLPGDVVLTGTPAGVGPLEPGDHLLATLNDQLRCETIVTA